MRRTSWIWVAALVGAAACGGEDAERVNLGGERDDRPDARASWSPELTAQVDSANAAYAAGDYQDAADRFTAVTQEQPELGVAWFGVYMAESAMGNEDAARAALARAESLNPGLARMHDAAIDSAAEMPEGR